MVQGVEVESNWLLCPFMSDVRAMAVHPFIQSLFHLTHVLAATLLVLDQVDEVGGLTCGRIPHAETLA